MLFVPRHGVAAVGGGPSLWLREDRILSGPSLTQWTDKSGNGNHFTAAGGASPTDVPGGLNTHVTTLFNGTSNEMSGGILSDIFDDDAWVVMAVVKWTRGGGGSNNEGIFGNHNWKLGSDHVASEDLECRYGLIDRKVPSGLAVATWGMFYAALDLDGGGNCEVGDRTSSSSGAGSNIGNLRNTIYVGSSGLGDFFKGEIAEIIAYRGTQASSLVTDQFAAWTTYYAI